MTSKPKPSSSRRTSSPADKPEDVDAIVQERRRVVKALEVYSRDVELTFDVTGP